MDSAKIEGNIFCGILLEMEKLTFREFNKIIASSTFCEFEKRDFENKCFICKKLGINREVY